MLGGSTAGLGRTFEGGMTTRRCVDEARLARSVKGNKEGRIVVDVKSFEYSFCPQDAQVAVGDVESTQYGTALCSKSRRKTSYAYAVPRKA